MTSKILPAILILTMLIGCSLPDKTDFILQEKDLIPEGTAFNSEENQLYIGSIYKQKILGLDKHGKETEVVASDQFGKFSPLGIFYDESNKKIWACVAMAPIVNHNNDKNWETTILTFNPENGKIIKKYQRLSDSKPMLLNDLTITNNGTVYITESTHNRIYRITAEGDSLEMFHQLETFNFPNGITHRNNDLFLATDQGIVKLNISSRTTQLLKASEGIDATVIDGLEVHKNYFIGHQSIKVTRFFFNNDITELTKSEILDDGEDVDSSTTGVVHDGNYSFIVNSQLSSGIDQLTKQVKPLDSLEQIIIRKLKL